MKAFRKFIIDFQSENIQGYDLIEIGSVWKFIIYYLLLIPIMFLLTLLDWLIINPIHKLNKSRKPPKIIQYPGESLFQIYHYSKAGEIIGKHIEKALK